MAFIDTCKPCHVKSVSSLQLSKAADGHKVLQKVDGVRSVKANLRLCNVQP